MYESNGFMTIFYHIASASCHVKIGQTKIVKTAPHWGDGVSPVHFPFFAARRSRLDFGFGPFGGKSDANPPAFISTNRQVACVSKWLQWWAIPQHLPVVEYFIPFRL